MSDVALEPAASSLRVGAERATIACGALVLVFCVPQPPGEPPVSPLLRGAVEPLAALGRLLGDERAIAARVDALVLLAFLLAARALLGAFVAPAVARRFVVVVMAASMFAAHARAGSAQTLPVAALALGALLLVRGRGPAATGALAAGVAAAPPAIVGLLLVGAERAWSRRGFFVVVASLVLGAAYVVVASERVDGGVLALAYGPDARRTTPSILPYAAQPGLSQPFLLGAYSLLFSFGKGLLFFAPGILLCFVRPTSRFVEEERALLRAWLLLVAGLVVAYAKWRDGAGGDWPGPRWLLLAAVPASFAVARHVSDEGAPLRRRCVVLAAALSSWWVGYVGGVDGTRGAPACAEPSQQHLCWYVAEMSPLGWAVHAPAPPAGAAQTLAALWWAAALVVLFGPLAAGVGRDAARAGAAALQGHRGGWRP